MAAAVKYKRIFAAMLAVLMLLAALPVYAFADEAIEQAPELPTEPAPEVPAEPAPEVPVEPAPEVPTEPAPELPTEPEVQPEPSPEPETGEKENTGSDTETGTNPAPEASPVPTPEASPAPTLPPLPESWSHYFAPEPEDFNIQDIYERVYLGEALDLSQSMELLQLELAEALDRLASWADSPDVYVRYNEGLEPTYLRCMAEVAAVFCAVENWDSPAELATKKLSTEQVNMLRSIFWNMLSISAVCREDVSYAYTEEVGGEYEENRVRHLQIDVTFCSAADYLSAATEQQSAIMAAMLSEPAYSSIIRICSGAVSYEENGTEHIIAALPEDTAHLKRAMVEAACSLVGRVPYFWGGNSDLLGWDERWNVPKAVTSDGNGHLGHVYPYGLDCAGFISWVFTSTGVNNIGHMGATTLYGHSDPVSPEDAKPGDVIFFQGTMGDDVDGITHCGLYVGNNMMIHCGNPCSYADLTDSYWQQHFYGFGRLYD